MNLKNSTKYAFTLVEILVGILIVSFVFLAAFQAISVFSIAKIRLVESSDIERQAFFLAEKIFGKIKQGGSIDYEEYWNVSNSMNLLNGNNYASGHILDTNRSFGNYGLGGIIGTSTFGNYLYYCLSKNGAYYNSTATGCVTDFNINENNAGINTNYKNKPQRYGEYALQFYDFNSDADNNKGDEDSSNEAVLNFYGDDDDMDLGNGPIAFSGGKVTELYLLSHDGTKRTFFRFSASLDPYAPSGYTCSGMRNMTGSGCLGTIEYLQLDGSDAGKNHDGNGVFSGDNTIDTWKISQEFVDTTNSVIAGSDSKNYWQKLVPDSMNVEKFEIFVYPSKNPDLAWAEADDNYEISPYVKIHLVFTPSWKEKRKITGTIPQVDISTTISFSDFDIR